MEVGKDKETTGYRYLSMEQLAADQLHAGDVVTLETTSGSSYRIEVTDVDGGVPKGSLSRESDHGVGGDTESWERVGETPFELRGSCDRVLTRGQDVLLAEEEQGVLIVGSHVVLGTVVDGEDGALVTSPIVSITLSFRTAT
jgi:hypothetical protein